jgi:hypothetical protein
VLRGEPKALFLPGSFYSLAAAGGCAAYVLGLRAEVAPVPLAVGCGAAIVGVRLLSTHREWRTNPAESLDLSHRVARIRRRTSD